MNWKKALILILLSLVLSILDISFFASLSINGATIISTFLVIITFALILTTNQISHDLILFQSVSLMVYSIFSSVPVWLLFLMFFVIPALISFVRKNYISLPTVLLAAGFYLIANFLFDVSLFLYFREINTEAVKSLVYFVLINTIAGTMIYALAIYLRGKKAEIRV